MGNLIFFNEKNEIKLSYEIDDDNFKLKKLLNCDYKVIKIKDGYVYLPNFLFDIYIVLYKK